MLCLLMGYSIRARTCGACPMFACLVLREARGHQGDKCECSFWRCPSFCNLRAILRQWDMSPLSKQKPRQIWASILFVSRFSVMRTLDILEVNVTRHISIKLFNEVSHLELVEHATHPLQKLHQGLQVSVAIVHNLDEERSTTQIGQLPCIYVSIYTHI